MMFTCDERGLYVKDKKPQVDWCMVMVEEFTDRQVERAQQCRKLLHDLDAPSYADLGRAIQMNLIKNNPVIFQDIKLAEDVFGKDISVLKGKETRPHPSLVTQEYLWTYQPN